MFRLLSRFNVQAVLTLAFLLTLVLAAPVVAGSRAGELAWTGDRSRLLPAETVVEWRSPPVDVAALVSEDDANLIVPDIPWRVGFPMEVDLTPGNSGTWEDLPDGGRLWRLHIFTEGALWTVLGFDVFQIQPGGLDDRVQLDGRNGDGAVRDVGHPQARRAVVSTDRGRQPDGRVVLAGKAGHGQAGNPSRHRSPTATGPGAASDSSKISAGHSGTPGPATSTRRAAPRPTTGRTRKRGAVMVLVRRLR